MASHNTPAATQRVFFGSGAVSTVERIARKELEHQLESDETVLLSDPGSETDRDHSGSARSRSRARQARGPSPLKALMQQATSSADHVKTLRSSLTPDAARSIRDQPRKSMALIDFEGRLASPCKEGDFAQASNVPQSLLDDPFSPWRPATAAEPALSPLLHAGDAIFEEEEEDLGGTQDTGVHESSMSPTRPHSASFAVLEEAVKASVGTAESEAARSGQQFGVELTPTEEEAVTLAPREETSASVNAEQTSSQTLIVSTSSARSHEAERPPARTSPAKSAPKVVLRAVDAMKGKQVGEKPSAAFAGPSRSRIAQPALRGPATNRLPLASTSRLPALTRSLNPAKAKATARIAIDTSANGLRSPSKPVMPSRSVLAPPSKPVTHAGSRSVSPGAVQRAAERVFGIASLGPSESALPTEPLQRSPRSPRRPLSPRRADSPKRNNGAQMLASPKKASPRRAISPKTVAHATTSAIDHLSDAKEAVGSVESWTGSTTAKARKRAATAPSNGSPPAMAPARAVFEAPAALPTAQIQQLTNRHTTRNAVAYNTYTTIVERRAGPRPPSPSARLRKQATSAARDERAKKREAVQEAARRASDAVTADEEVAATVAAKGKKRAHARGAGDEGVFETPAKRRRQADSKELKWDRGLISVVGSDLLGQKEQDGLRPAQGIMKIARQLDQFGNVLNAKAPLSPLVPREAVTIVRIIYDDDESA